MSLGTFLLFSIVVHRSWAVYQEAACANQGGTCMLISQPCQGFFASGKCPRQPLNVKCCVRVQQESACADAGGNCQLTSQSCAGELKSGKCPTQPSNVKCCVKTAGPGICQYSRSLNKLDCWDNSGKNCQSPHKCASCSTIQNVGGGGKLPVGTFRIGTFYGHGSANTPWFNLYPKRQDGGFWDYNSKSPDFDCRGGFGLHPGSISLGCVTVSDATCFEQVKAILNSAPIQDFTATECKGCKFGYCILGTNTISAKATGQLTVVP